jgi:hypothetical protein
LKFSSGLPRGIEEGLAEYIKVVFLYIYIIEYYILYIQKIYISPVYIYQCPPHGGDEIRDETKLKREVKKRMILGSIATGVANLITTLEEAMGSMIGGGKE